MKRIPVFSFCLGLLLLLPHASMASQLPAPPSAALFYPNEVHLTVEERIVPENIPGKGAGLRIVLPASASRATFSATVNDAPANGFYWLEETSVIAPAAEDGVETAPMEAGEDEEKKLRDAVAALEEETDRQKAVMKTRQARVSLWENINPNEEKFTVNDMIKLDDAFAERLADLYAAIDKDERDLEKLRQRLDRARVKLNEHTASRTRHVAVIPYAGPMNKPAPVRYSYVMPASSQTSYRLTAYPAKEQLKIEQEVTLFQNSGLSWDDVDVYISTTRRDTAIRPASLFSWRISLGTKEPPMPVMRERAMGPQAQMANMAEFADMKRMAPPAPKPAQEEKGTFRLWSLGKKTVNDNVAVTLPLAQEIHAAQYHYTIQPSVNTKGFLTATLALDKAIELPLGKARLFVDDVIVGEQNLSINGTRATLFFGTDPQVTATMRDLKRSSGEKGLISKEQSMLWHWEITVRNTRSRAVDVWVEDPLPDEQDSAIKLTVTSTPKPEKAATATQLGGAKIYRWKLPLQPNETQVIDHKVELRAPADKILNPGRGR